MHRKQPRPLHPLIKLIKAEAKARGWRAYRLGQETGLAANTIQRMLEGRTSPTIDTVSVVAKALDITIKGTRRR